MGCSVAGENAVAARRAPAAGGAGDARSSHPEAARQHRHRPGGYRSLEPVRRRQIRRCLVPRAQDRQGQALRSDPERTQSIADAPGSLLPLRRGIALSVAVADPVCAVKRYAALCHVFPGGIPGSVPSSSRELAQGASFLPHALWRSDNPLYRTAGSSESVEEHRFATLTRLDTCLQVGTNAGSRVPARRNERHLGR